MIKYHGTPITPKEIFYKAMPNKNALVSFAHPNDLEKALEVCNKVCLDNGAFSFWTKNKKVDWNNYYEWIEKHIDKIEFFIIPDVIDGTEKENDLLIEEYINTYQKKYDYSISGYCGMNKLLKKGMPVWHIAESFDRLKSLMERFNYIAFGSSGEYSELGTFEWHKRMNEAMKIVCNSDGVPEIKIHMLRCLDPKIFTQYPFYSGDSTNLARNHSRDGWRQILNRIEKYNSPTHYKFKTYYETGCLFSA